MWICQIDWAAVATVALVFVTGYYAWSTHRILKESQRTREAVERQALAVENSNRLFLQQSEQAASIGRTIVASAIQTAKRNIDQWKSYDLYSMVTNRYLPGNFDLNPPNALSAIEHARIISTEGSIHLSSAFDSLRQATLELNILSKWEPSKVTFPHDHVKSTLHFIELASFDLDQALTYFHEVQTLTEKKSQ